MDWNCTYTEERLSDYLEGALTAEESAAFSAHARVCANCGPLVARVSSLVNQMHRLEPMEQPEHLVSKILDATLGPQPSKEGWRRWFTWAPAMLQPRFAMGIATVAACCVIVVQAGGITPGKLRRANLNPADMFRSANRQAHLTYARGVKFVNDLRVVYEIQSRLEPAPAPATIPPSPRQEPETKPQPSNPQQKSETHPGHSEARSERIFAYIVSSDLTVALDGSLP
ncbi:MAG TPA: zf-HC2 domain-containing protein [Candidatus Acidoferrum sp.]|nr:zf-HC2 domain-containing protein [Candidatus Acidoferrum sp.]